MWWVVICWWSEDEDNRYTVEEYDSREEGVERAIELVAEHSGRVDKARVRWGLDQHLHKIQAAWDARYFPEDGYRHGFVLRLIPKPDDYADCQKSAGACW
jgi:hypothetical protein